MKKELESILDDIQEIDGEIYRHSDYLDDLRHELDKIHNKLEEIFMSMEDDPEEEKEPSNQ